MTTPYIANVTPGLAIRGATTNQTITGTGFLPGALVSVSGTGVTVNNVVVSEAQIVFSVFASAGAPLGARDVTVTNVGGAPGPNTGSLGICSGCLAVITLP